MERRKFFRNAGLLGLGSVLFSPLEAFSQENSKQKNNHKKPKNIIFMVSDGMSIGTLNMTDLYLQRTTGTGTKWINLYRDNKVSRGMMDMASASSLVTDSAAASSSWGGGNRVANGTLNVGENGELYKTIWKKFKEVGKKAGCVTTVPITHATPAGFLVQSKSRYDQEGIAEKYLVEKYDVLMGGGKEYFEASSREDAKDLFTSFEKAGFEVVKTRKELLSSHSKKPFLGVFHAGGLPYTLDRNNDEKIAEQIPTLAEMTTIAIEKMKTNKEGFVLQIEGGKVDWAAHSNCVGGLINEQIAFDQALKVAIDFAAKDGETLVVITTDHGNSNPGLLYGKEADKQFDTIQKFTHTNEWILNEINSDFNISQVIDKIKEANGFEISKEDAYHILGYYNGLEKSDTGLYNYKKLPFKLLSEIQKKHTNVGWIGDNHSADFVELAMFGPGNEKQPPFIKNTDLHKLLLEVCEMPL